MAQQPNGIKLIPASGGPISCKLRRGVHPLGLQEKPGLTERLTPSAVIHLSLRLAFPATRFLKMPLGLVSSARPCLRTGWQVAKSTETVFTRRTYRTKRSITPFVCSAARTANISRRRSFAALALVHHETDGPAGRFTDLCRASSQMGGSRVSRQLRTRLIEAFKCSLCPFFLASY